MPGWRPIWCYRKGKQLGLFHLAVDCRCPLPNITSHWIPMSSLRLWGINLLFHLDDDTKNPMSTPYGCDTVMSIGLIVELKRQKGYACWFTRWEWWKYWWCSSDGENSEVSGFKVWSCGCIGELKDTLNIDFKINSNIFWLPLLEELASLSTYLFLPWSTSLYFHWFWCFYLKMQIHSGIGDVVQGRKWKRSLPLVSLSQLCPYFQMEM